MPVSTKQTTFLQSSTLKKLYHHLRDFIREDFHPLVYGITFLLLAAYLTVNYTTGYFIQKTYGGGDDAGAFAWFVALMAVPYLTVLGLQRVSGQLPKEGLPMKFWMMLLFGVAMVCITMWFPYHKTLAREFFPPNLLRWASGLFWHAKRLVFIVLPLVLFVFAMRKQDPGYLGLRRASTSIGPYFLILCMVLPLIFWASFRPDFQATYPFYQPSEAEGASSISPFLRTLISELVYGTDFFSVEWLYRGFFVLGMVKWLGPRAVLPMAALYCSIHFGKPAGEAAASFFGGYALGVFSYKTKSVWGGVIVHLGVAWSMDAMAMIQKAM